MGKSRRRIMELERSKSEDSSLEDEPLDLPETYYAGAYWLARHESAESCARRAAAFFKHLEHCAPAWKRWHEVVRSFDDRREPLLTPDAPSFERLFARGENQQPPDGYDFWLWSGESPASSINVNAACGSASPRSPSSCVLRPPVHGPLDARALSAPLMAGVLRAMALAWEPEWAVATSDEFRDRVVERTSAGTFIGWLNYFSPRRGPLPPLPAPTHVEPVEGGGSLLILTPEPLTASNPEHRALATQVQSVLERARLLAPLHPHGSA